MNTILKQGNHHFLSENLLRRSKASLVLRFQSRGLSSQRQLSVATAAVQQHPRKEAVAAVASVREDWEKNATGLDESLLQGKRDGRWWTGVAPEATPGFSPQGKLFSLAQPALDNLHAESVQGYYDNTWTLTELLFSGLQGEEAFYRPPYHHLRHPLMFYYGHPACFYVNKMRVSGILDKGIDPHFEEIFEVGVDEMRWDDMSKNTMDWPTVSEVHDYRKQVHALVTEVIQESFPRSGDVGAKVTMEDPLWSLFMGFEHERIHLETSSVLFRELPLRLVRKPEQWPEAHSVSAHQGTQQEDFPANGMVANDGGRVNLGKEDDFPSFGWDNEYGVRQVDVPAFKASKFMVSNGEFYEFVTDGGYREEKYWSDDGWGWRKFRNAKWPYFWKQDGPQGSHRYKLRTVFEVVNMPWSAPAIVNYHEAKAFCKWKSERDATTQPLRLPAEAEHQLMRNEEHRTPLASPQVDPTMNFGGEDMPAKAGMNLNFASGSEVPVDQFPPTSAGFHDVLGNAWEWTEDHFNPLQGFKVHTTYDDFSTPCFDGEHQMIVGGSFISTGDAGANLHCRYHFRPHFLQHSGFRYVEPSMAEDYPAAGVARHLNPPQDGQAEQDGGSENNVYETDKLVDMYMALHFGQDPSAQDGHTVREHEGLPKEALMFPQRCAQLAVETAKHVGSQVGPNARALDLGCSVGGSSFELTKDYGSVVGIDFSNAFVQKANEMRQASNGVEYAVPMEGRISAGSKVARLDDDQIRRENATFMVGDACDLPSAEEFNGKFDVVLMANLLCRLPNPKKCLEQMPELINDDGLLVLVSPYSWLEEFTPESQWLGGTPDTPDASSVIQTTLQSLGFTKVKEQEMPLMIREHERKYQYIISHGMAFKKTG